MNLRSGNSSDWPFFGVCFHKTSFIKVQEYVGFLWLDV